MAGWVGRGEQMSRAQRHAAPLAIIFVTAATLFSLITQANALGHGAADLAWTLGVEPHTLLLRLLPHALPELFAVFLPLAAWSIASRRGAWDELLAATIATTAIAVPLVLLAAAIETWVTPLYFFIATRASRRTIDPWQTSRTFPIPTSRLKCSSTSSLCWWTSGRRGAGRAEWSPPRSSRSRPSVTICGS